MFKKDERGRFISPDRIIDIPIPITGIYMLTSPAGEVYIGHSRNIKARFLQHKRSYRTCKIPGIKDSFSFYGPLAHTLIILHELPCDIVRNTLIEYERVYIDFYLSAGFKMLNVNMNAQGGITPQAIEKAKETRSRWVAKARKNRLMS
jgi:hypothetical protein